MNAEERMALVERVAVAIVRAGYNPATAHDIARAALAVIEPVARADERAKTQAPRQVDMTYAAGDAAIRSTSPTPHPKETPDAG